MDILINPMIVAKVYLLINSVLFAKDKYYIKNIKLFNKYNKRYENNNCDSKLSGKKSDNVTKNNKKWFGSQGLTKCKTYNDNQIKYRKAAANELFNSFKLKIKEQIDSVNSNPKLSRVETLACYLKILDVLSSSSSICKYTSSKFSTSSLIANSEREVRKTNKEHTELIKTYVNYITNNYKDSYVVLNYLKKIDANFAKTIQTIIDTYKCESTA